MVRRFGDQQRVGAPGPEPLSEAFNGDYLYEKSRNKRTLIKPWLMDNKLVVGVGNIYASESLFSAGILPDRPAGSLSKAEAELLVKTIKAVLQRSIEQGGTTLRDFCSRTANRGISRRSCRFTGGRENRAARAARRSNPPSTGSAAPSLPPLPALSITRRRASPLVPG